MIEFIAGTLALLVGAAVLLFLVVALPLMLVGAVFKLLFGLILLPFRLLGVLFGAAVVALGFVLKIGLFLLAILAGVGLLAGGTVLLALAPVILLGLGIWLLVRIARPGPRVTPAGV